MKPSQLFSLLTGVAFLLVSLTSDQCDGPEQNSLPCMTSAVAKDFTGMDGCGMLLILENGRKLLAANLDTYSPLTDGEQVRISYETSEGMMSACMTEDTIVDLTCLSRKSKKEWVIDCPVMVDPFRIEWSACVMKEINPRQVEELEMDGQRAYRFYAPTGARIYNCNGELLCSYTYNTPDGCDLINKKVTDFKIIYVVND